MTPSAGSSQVVSALEHYERCIAEGNDPCKDGALMQTYMARWDGPKFFSMLGNLSGKAVLEVGVGTGRLARQVLEHKCLSFTGIDLSPETIERARRNIAKFRGVDLRVGDIETTPLPRDYDLAYSVLTFMHIADKGTALANMVGALRPGGVVVLSIADVGPWLDYDSRRVRLHPAAPDQYAAWLTALGCAVVEQVPLIDGWTGPEGTHSETYGQAIATLVKAAKREGTRNYPSVPSPCAADGSNTATLR